MLYYRKIMDEISYSGDQPKKTRRLSKRGIFFLGFLIAILVLAGGVLFFVSKKSSNIPRRVIKVENTITPTSNETPTPKESPTPIVSLKKSNLKISVENGSGEAGIAADAAKILKDAGYSVVSTGNADSYDYKGLTIRIKKSKNSYLSGLIKDLSTKYNVSSSDASSDLGETETFDALIIVGK